MEVLLCFRESRKRAKFPALTVRKEELDMATFRLLGLSSCRYQIYEEKYNEYCDLDNFEEIRDACKIRILSSEDNISDSNSADISNEGILVLPNDHLEAQPPMKLRNVPWRSGQFKLSINSFDDQVRGELEDAIELFNTTSKLHNMSWKLKHQLCNNVEKYLVSFTMYPNEIQYEDVCSSIIKTYPCLANSHDYDPSGFGHLRLMFYNRMCTKRRSSGDDPECNLNAGLGRKNSGKKAVRATMGETNFLPKVLLPHTMESLALKRDEILLCRQAIPRDGGKIADLMEETFPRRRHELLVSDKFRKLETWLLMWPELTEPDELRREMQRLNCVDFAESLLDWMTHNLESLCIVANKSRMKRLALSKHSETAPMESLQEIPYLLADRAPFFLLAAGDGFDPNNYSSAAHIVASSHHTFHIKAEGKPLVSNIPTFDTACWMLLAIYYCFNLQYPTAFRKSLFLLQRMCGIRNGPYPKEVKNLLTKLEQTKLKPV